MTTEPLPEGWLEIGKTINYWAIVWFFNFVGGALIAYMYYYSGLPLKYDGYILQHFIPAGIGKITAPFHELFIRGIFCNVFVCMSIWTATSESNLAGKFFAIMWMIGAFVACSMEHCVANMFIITKAIISKAHYIAASGGDVNAAAALLHTTAYADDAVEMLVARIADPTAPVRTIVEDVALLPRDSTIGGGTPWRAG